MSESYAGKINRKLLKKRRIINAAAGREPSDLVLKNATYVNVFSNELCHADIAVAEGLIVGMGDYSGKREVDVTGKIAVVIGLAVVTAIACLGTFGTKRK